MHKLDCAEPQKERRKTGRFFTQKHVSEGISTLVRSIDPEYIIEPYIGTGSLIKPLIEQYRGVGNDIQQNFIEKLKQKYRESKWTFTSLNTITTNLETLFERWKIPQNEKLLIFTNPPFGTASTNKLLSKKGELNGKKSRKIQIS